MADNKSCGDVEKATKVLAKAGSEFDVLRYAAEAKTKETQDTRNKVSEKLMAKMDFSETIKGLKALQREARKATAALKELEDETDKPLLTIELESLDSVPKVLYKGKEIKDKTAVDFYWTTKTDKPGEVRYIVKHYERDKHGVPTHVVIGDGGLT